MKTEWTQEPHTTVRWALFEALRASDKATTVDYWDVVVENLIRELKLKQEWTFKHDTFGTTHETYSELAYAKEVRGTYSAQWNLVTYLISEAKPVESTDD